MRLALGFLFAFPLPLLAQVTTGNDLLPACESTDNLAPTGFCLGYIIGHQEGFVAGVAIPLMAVGTTDSASDLNASIAEFSGICMPEEVNYIQQRDIVVQYLQAHPETRHEPARALIYQAMRETFPCEGAE